MTGYESNLKRRLKEYEALCRRCGVCCGADNDPCVNLMKDGERHICMIYDFRMGPQKTVSGNSFTCVEIRENIAKGFNNPGCAYTRRAYPKGTC